MRILFLPVIAVALRAGRAAPAAEALAAEATVILVPSPPPLPTPAADPAGDLRGKLRALAAELSCARLGLSAERQVEGFVGGEVDLRRVRALAGPAASTAVAIRPWPQCEALLTLDKPLTQSEGVSLMLDPPARHCPNATLCGGDALVATVHLPAWPAYLYLVYLPVGGGVLILDQPAGVVPTPHRPGDVVVLGRRGTPLQMRVGPPFGREMLIALAAASPLFENKLPDTLNSKEFFPMLRTALSHRPTQSYPERADPERVVAAAALPIVTSAR